MIRVCIIRTRTIYRFNDTLTPYVGILFYVNLNTPYRDIDIIASIKNGFIASVIVRSYSFEECIGIII